MPTKGNSEQTSDEQQGYNGKIPLIPSYFAMLMVMLWVTTGRPFTDISIKAVLTSLTVSFVAPLLCWLVSP